MNDTIIYIGEEGMTLSMHQDGSPQPVVELVRIN